MNRAIRLAAILAVSCLAAAAVVTAVVRLETSQPAIVFSAPEGKQLKMASLQALQDAMKAASNKRITVWSAGKSRVVTYYVANEQTLTIEVRADQLTDLRENEAVLVSTGKRSLWQLAL